MRRVLAMPLAVLALVGCHTTASRPVATAPRPKSPAPVSTPAASSPAAATTTKAARGVPVISQGPLVPTREQWDYVRSDVNPRRLVITFGTGDCDGAAKATATDKGKVVSVALTVARLSYGACDAALRLRWIAVDLPTDLAGRRVVDAADGSLHQAFNGAQLLAPHALPAGFAVVFELPSDALQPAVAIPRYWARTWSVAPRTTLNGVRGPCTPARQRSLQLYQGSGGFPTWGPGQLQRIGAISVQGERTALQRVKVNGDLLVSWKDSATGQRVQLGSGGGGCGDPKPYTVAAFTRIAESVR